VQFADYVDVRTINWYYTESVKYIQERNNYNIKCTSAMGSEMIVLLIKRIYNGTMGIKRDK